MLWLVLNCVQVTPSGEVRITEPVVLLSNPTTTNCVPDHTMPCRSPTSLSDWAVQVVPSGEVTTVSASPTATNLLP